MKKVRWKLPESEDSPFSACFSVSIPDNQEYRIALFGAIMELTRAWNWENTPDKRAAKTALKLRQSILRSFRRINCPQPSFESGEFWYWNFKDNKGLWDVTPLTLVDPSAPTSQWVAGQGFVSQCTPNGAKGAGMEFQNPYPVEGQFLLKVAGFYYDDEVWIDGTYYDPQVSGGLSPQWIYMGYGLLGTGVVSIQLKHANCDPDNYPRILELGVRTNIYPFGAVRGEYPF